MRVLVVGGNRFVGLELTVRMLLEGHEVAVLALDAPPPDVAPHVKWIRANRNHPKELADRLKNEPFDAIIDNIAYEPLQVESLLGALSQAPSRYVLTSSVDVYGLNIPRGYPENQAPMDPSAIDGSSGHDRYVRGKRGCELVLRKSGVPWTVLRPSLVCGRRDNVTPPPITRHLNADEDASRSLFFPARVCDGGPILLRADDEAVFKLVWVQDVGRAAVLALASERAVNEAYNVCGDEIWTHERLVRALCAAAGRDAELAWVTSRHLAQAGIADYEPAYGRGPFWSVAESHKLRDIGWAPTPSEAWLPKLVEAAPPPGQRPAYDRRLAEIALARHILRRQGGATRIRPAAAPSEPEQALPDPFEVRPPIPGSFSIVESSARRLVIEATKPLRPSFFRPFLDGHVSAVGVGTWMGDTSAATDQLYVEALTHAVRGGINVLDTAINYRSMKAERCVGEAVRRLTAEGIERSSICVSSKVGFVVHDAMDPRPPADFIRDEYVHKGQLSPAEAARGHSFAPAFIRAQLERSLSNLGLSTIDLYYLHNPEIQREALGAAAFVKLLAQAFETLEAAVQEGKIRGYGLATWQALRAPPDEAGHIALADALAAARSVAGEKHHLRAIQLPFNVLRTEGYTRHNHEIWGRRASTFEAAHERGLAVFTSATVIQGALAEPLAKDRLARVGPKSAAAAAIQFARSAPGVGTALVGMRRIAHVDEALSIGTLEPLTRAAFDNVCE